MHQVEPVLPGDIVGEERGDAERLRARQGLLVAGVAVRDAPLPVGLDSRVDRCPELRIGQGQVQRGGRQLVGAGLSETAVVRAEPGHDPAPIEADERPRVGDSAAGRAAVVQLPGGLVAAQQRLRGAEHHRAAGQPGGRLRQGPPAGRARDPGVQVGGGDPGVGAGVVDLLGVRAGSDLGVRIVPGIDGDALPGAPVDAEHRVPHDLPVGGAEQLPGPVLQANCGGSGAEEPDPAGVHHADPDAVVDLPFLTCLRERLLGPNPGQSVVHLGRETGAVLDRLDVPATRHNTPPPRRERAPESAPRQSVGERRAAATSIVMPARLWIRLVAFRAQPVVVGLSGVGLAPEVLLGAG